MTIVAQKTIAQKVETPEKFADKLGKHFARSPPRIFSNDCW